VTVQDTNQCYGTDSIHILTHQYHGDLLSNDTAACAQSIVTLSLPDSFNYSWETGSISNTIDVTTEGTYVVQITDTFNCVFSDSINVVFYQLPEVNLGPDTSFCPMYETMLITASSSGNIDTYRWNGNETFSNQIEIDTIGAIVLVVNSFENCSASDTIQIENECDGFEIDFPNVITTNNDGFNEYFEPINYSIDVERLLAAYRFTKFEVYNRWGNLVYESENEMPKWNGTNMNNSVLSDGTYFWIVYYQLGGSENVQNGFVEVMHN
jgi:gliding motility-associated-like protein